MKSANGNMPLSQNIGYSPCISIGKRTEPNCGQSFGGLTAEDIERKENQKELVKTSYCMAIQNGSYIVLASDSRSTTMGKNGEILRISDEFEKIVYLPTAKIAFIGAGINTFNGIPFADFVRKHEDALVGKNVHEALLYIANLMKENLCERETNGKSIYKCETVTLLAAKGLKAEWCDVYTDREIRCLPLQLLWKVGQSDDVISRLYLNGNGLMISTDDLTLQELVNFAKHIVEAQISYAFFKKDNPNIGGAVQICVMGKNGKVEL